MKIFTDEFMKIINQMAGYGHKDITIRVYPENNSVCVSSEWRLKDKSKTNNRCNEVKHIKVKSSCNK